MYPVLVTCVLISRVMLLLSFLTVNNHSTILAKTVKKEEKYQY